MPRKVKPSIWQLSPLPFMVVAGMRERAIGLMLRDMWCAAVRELAGEGKR